MSDPSQATNTFGTDSFVELGEEFGAYSEVPEMYNYESEGAEVVQEAYEPETTQAMVHQSDAVLRDTGPRDANHNCEHLGYRIEEDAVKYEVILGVVGAIILAIGAWYAIPPLYSWTRKQLSGSKSKKKRVR